MPACKHGGWDYCSQCLAEYETEGTIARLTRERDQIHAELETLLERLTRERDEALAARAEAFLRCDIKFTKLRALLREVEWAGSGFSCPVCMEARQGPFKGHSESCRLAKALEQTGGTDD